MTIEETIKTLRLMTEPGQERNNKAIAVAIKALVEKDRKEKENGFMEVRTGDMRQAHGHLPR